MDLLGEAVGDRAEDPGEASWLGNRDGAVAVFHRGVDLGPGLRGLAQLEAGFSGQSDRPSRAEEGNLVRVDPARGNLHRQRALGIGGRGLDIVAEGAEEVLQGARRESGLDDGGFVGEVEDDILAGVLGGGATRHGGDEERGMALLVQALHDLDDLRRCAGARQADDPIEGASPRELGGGAGISRALACPLAVHGVGLRDEPRGAASNDGDVLAVGGQRVRGKLGDAAPQVGLADDFIVSTRHCCSPGVWNK